MCIEERYPLLIGCSDNGCEDLHNIKEVAEYICREGMNSDVRIVEPDSKFFLNTFGIYIDRIVDKEYRTELLKVLIPMQQHIDGTAEFFGEMEMSL